MIDFEKYLEQLREYPQVDNLFEDEVNQMWVAELTTGEEMQFQYMWNGKIKVTAIVLDKVDAWFSEGNWLQDITKATELGQ
ncbi:hypothetical protein Kuja_0170 [Vibrio phage vB_VchM_Kuja]|uniref:Uncharacterized protein n=1 Tax=Vibrio phage vB_VchM_Kuja TaxID=2686437 RepID=A0A6B9J5J6_9CAUD|nr:hypothetical protein HWC83_gp017 [Vibrio phage vB_VchM_Kuja]QGZ16008.1 hypothetical protein Kuja_0170 [Vibrio phage vB_VchM_Kuja]